MDAIVIGAGPAGLAVAACLKRAGPAVTLLERGDTVAPAWHRHYDRLHLHTSRARSALPFHPMPKGPETFPGRAEVIAYLEGYARAEGLTPLFGTLVERVFRDGRKWLVRHDHGQEIADIVVFATGLNAIPRAPDWPGLDAFPGTTLHSHDYRNAAPFAGRKALVVGCGNSGADIALDLAEAGVEVTISARGPVNILPGLVFGIPVTSMQLVRRALGSRVADRVTAPLFRALVGRPADYGFATPEIGPVEQIEAEGRIPLIDVGTLAAIRAGRIAVRGAVAGVEGDMIRFDTGAPERFDTLIFATGYRQDLRDLLPEDADLALDDSGTPHVCGAPTGLPGLYFCSYHVAPNGQIDQIGIEAQSIARAVSALVA